MAPQAGSAKALLESRHGLKAAGCSVLNQQCLAPPCRRQLPQLPNSGRQHMRLPLQSLRVRQSFSDLHGSPARQLQLHRSHVGRRQQLLRSSRRSACYGHAGKRPFLQGPGGRQLFQVADQHINLMGSSLCVSSNCTKPMATLIPKAAYWCLQNFYLPNPASTGVETSRWLAT